MMFKRFQKTTKTNIARKMKKKVSEKKKNKNLEKRKRERNKSQSLCETINRHQVFQPKERERERGREKGFKK